MQGFVKYRLPFSNEVVEMNGTWEEKDHLQGFKNADFVFSHYSNSPYLVFKASNDSKEVDLSLCYRNSDNEACLNFGEYLGKVEELIARIKEGDFKKIIFSRRHKVKGMKDPFSVFETLNKQYKNSFNYILGIEGQGVWLGASPEVLVQSSEDRYEMHSLAGTIERNEKEKYNWSKKEIEEQKYVTDYLVNKFEEIGIHDLKKEGPINFEHGRVAHLKTTLTIKATNDQLNELLRKVPPSPAVCGIPKEDILNEIQQIEGYDRRFYTGTLGVYQEDNVHLFVNLRCMEFLIDQAYLYLGGGITADSDPEAEWKETEFKSRTLLDLL